MQLTDNEANEITASYKLHGVIILANRHTQMSIPFLYIPHMYWKMAAYQRVTPVPAIHQFFYCGPDSNLKGTRCGKSSILYFKMDISIWTKTEQYSLSVFAMITFYAVIFGVIFRWVLP